MHPGSPHADVPDRLTAEQEFPAPQSGWEALLQVAATLCEVPVALLRLGDRQHQWCDASMGSEEMNQLPRELALDNPALASPGLVEIPDVEADPRSAAATLLPGMPWLRYYAGVTLRLADGTAAGVLSVLDRRPRQLTAAARQGLLFLAEVAVSQLEDERRLRSFVSDVAPFQALSECSPLGVFATDAAGDCTYSNTRWQAIFELGPEQALGTGWRRSLHPEDRERVSLAWQHAAQAGQPFDMAFRIQPSAGPDRVVRAIARPVFDDAGRVTGHVGCVEDISDRRLTERALQEESQRLTAIIEGAGFGTWEWNVQTGEMRINQRWEELLGYSLVELAPISLATWITFVHPDDLARSDELLKQHFEGRTPGYECEVRMRHRDGHWVWVLDRGRLLTRTAQGEPEWMFGTLLDIGARKAQEAALGKSRAVLQRTEALVRLGGWELEADAEGPYWSDQTCLIHGHPPGFRPTLQQAIEGFAPEARPIIVASVERCFATGQGWDLELPLLMQDGERRWVQTIGQAERQDGRIIRVYGSIQDITERFVQRRAIEAVHDQQLAVAADSSGIGVWDFDLLQGTVSWNPWMYRLYGLPEDAEGDGYVLWSRHLHPDDRAAAEQAVRVAVEGGKDFDTEFRIIWPDGRVRHIRAMARLIRDAEGQPLRLTGVNWDVTPIDRLTEELAEQHELLQVTLRSIGDSVITTDAEGKVAWLNPVAERLTGWTTAEARGLPSNQVFRVVDEETGLPWDDPVAACLRAGEVVEVSGHATLLSRDGRRFGIEDSAAPIRSHRGVILGAVLVFRDVTEQRRLGRELHFRASHDALTGLCNRMEFEQRLQEALSLARSEGSQHSLLFIDLDQFKLVNDHCGHAVGDQLLIQVTRLLAESVRAGDVLARLGGDEFAVILANCSPEHAQRSATQICERMEAFHFVHDGQRFHIGASIGLVPVDARWPSTSALMQAADSACYAAKEAGRNRVQVWCDTDEALCARRGETQWAARLEQALHEDRFVLFAQRIEPCQALPGAGLKAEVLLRLVDKGGELILPGAFLPASERFQLSARIDRWVLCKVLESLRMLPGLSAIDLICVNLSGQSLGDRAFHRHALEALNAADAAVCGRLCFEITETAAITNIADARGFIAQLHALGGRVALDDFGSGVSSFGYLKTLPVDLLKIDGQFIRDLLQDPLDVAAVRCFVDVARVMGLKTIAEFVERPDILARVQEMGIDHAQGYLLHQPEPLDVLLQRWTGKTAPSA
jgi:diguanylate cyclase